MLSILNHRCCDDDTLSTCFSGCSPPSRRFLAARPPRRLCGHASPPQRERETDSSECDRDGKRQRRMRQRGRAKFLKKMWNASRFCVSSLRRGHANLLCIVPILVYVPPKRVRWPGRGARVYKTRRGGPWPPAGSRGLQRGAAGPPRAAGAFRRPRPARRTSRPPSRQCAGAAADLPRAMQALKQA